VSCFDNPKSAILTVSLWTKTFNEC